MYDISIKSKEDVMRWPCIRYAPYEVRLEMERVTNKCLLAISEGKGEEVLALCLFRLNLLENVMPYRWQGIVLGTVERYGKMLPSMADDLQLWLQEWQTKSIINQTPIKTWKPIFSHN